MTPTSSDNRLLSLDAFRGMTIAAMILVNNPGTWSAVYPPLKHAAWHGLTPTDLIFPFFLFMIGVSIVFSLKKRLDNGVSRCDLSCKIVTRAIKIYILAILLQLFHRNSLPEHFTDLRLVGVLARIAIVFLICGLIFIYTNWKTQIVLCVVFLVGYFYCMTMIPMPQTGAVSLEPGNNIAALVDSYIVPGRMYQGPHRKEWNPELIPWDPEGLFSTIPALATCLTGIFAGLIIRSDKTQDRKVIILFFTGFVLAVVGYLWSLVFPLNKPLWTSSYVLVTSGFAFTILAACIYFIDMLGYKRIMYPAIVFGANAITMFCLSAIFAKLFFYGGDGNLNVHVMAFLKSTWGFSQELASMTYALLFVCANFIPAYLLYHFKIYVRL